MADISKITLPSGSTYNFKDQGARDLIDALESYSSYLGVTTTAITDGATTNPITIGGQSITAKNGSIVNYGSKEFIFNGTTWQEFGDLSALGALAYKDSASGSFTPAGTVSQPTFTGTLVKASVVNVADPTAAKDPYTPSGTVSQPTFTGNATTSTGTFTPSGSVSLSNTNQTTTVSKASSGTATYTPEGTVAAPTISVATAGSTTTVKNPTKQTVTKTVVAQAPSSTSHPANNITYYSVANETLSLYQLGYTTGDSITTEDVTVKTGDAAYSASAPSFTGTGARLVTGNISVPSSASFTGTEGNVSVSGTPSGTVSQPTFTGTLAAFEAEVVASGTVSQPTFAGTAGTVEVE